MTRQRSDRTPTFLWQGLMILLPVGALAVLGLSAIQRDRAAVQQDARRRAHEILAQMSEGLGRAVAGQLTRFDPLGQNWLAYVQSSAGAWPGSDSRRAWEAENGAGFEAKMKSWRAAFPDLKPENVFTFQLSFNANGTLEWPPEYDRAPQPPPWVTALSPEQEKAWAALRQSEYDPAAAGDIDGLAARFLATKPPPEAEANSELLRIRQNNTSQHAAENITNLLAFARLCGSAQSESGVPLSNLALAEALRRIGSSGLTETLWDWVTDEILNYPSVLSPALLEQVQALAATQPALAAAAGGLQSLWTAAERLREVADLIRASGKLNGLTTANLWVETDQGRWLCILNPGERVTAGADTNGNLLQITNRVTEVRVYPERMVEHAFSQAVRGSQIGVPDYFSVFAEIEGEPLALSPGAPASPGNVTDSEVLAEAAGVLTQPAAFLVDSSKTAEPLKATAEVEMLPSKPRYALRLALVDRGLLFAHQNQRQYIFGAVIALSSMAALVGFLAARNAFRRQLRLNELKSNFVSSVSHELRAPIASVRLMAESLERGKVPEAAKQNAYFRFIVQECRRLSALIENVLDFSRIEQGRKQYEFEPTDLPALAQQTVKLMETYAAEREVKLELQISNVQPSSVSSQISIDGRAIQQALVNLIDNAIKHSPKGGTVTVRLNAPVSPESNARESRITNHASLLLSVEDRGEGIPPSEHEKIFERFYRRGSELRRQTQGVGIGLSIVKHIVEAHGGKVLVRSALGQGSRFTIELPLSAKQGENHQ